MIAAEFCISFVQRNSDQISVVICRCQRVVHVRLQLERRAHAAKGKVAKPQLTVRQLKVYPGLFQVTVVSHFAAPPIRSSRGIAATIAAAWSTIEIVRRRAHRRR